MSSLRDGKDSDIFRERLDEATADELGLLEEDPAALRVREVPMECFVDTSCCRW